MEDTLYMFPWGGHALRSRDKNSVTQERYVLDDNLWVGEVHMRQPQRFSLLWLSNSDAVDQADTTDIHDIWRIYLYKPVHIEDLLTWLAAPLLQQPECRLLGVPDQSTYDLSRKMIQEWNQWEWHLTQTRHELKDTSGRLPQTQHHVFPITQQTVETLQCLLREWASIPSTFQLASIFRQFNCQPLLPIATSTQPLQEIFQRERNGETPHQ